MGPVVAPGRTVVVPVTVKEAAVSLKRTAETVAKFAPAIARESPTFLEDGLNQGGIGGGAVQRACRSRQAGGAADPSP